jgi:aminoglycoside phosphotransferase (APT) family kinase protein
VVLGRRLAEGASSEIFEWGAGTVIKLFRPRYAFAAGREQRLATAVHAAGIASPRVEGREEVDERPGIVFERLDGPTLLDELIARDRSPQEVGRLLAAIHLDLHAADGDELADLPDLAATARESGVDLPAGDALFHGDFHPGNVIMTTEGARTVDWVNAHRAPTTADVARTTMAVRYQALRGEQPEPALDTERRVRSGVLDAYLDAYLAASPSVADDLPFWLTRGARSLLRSEDDSADVADLRALDEERYHEVAHGALRTLLSR